MNTRRARSDSTAKRTAYTLVEILIATLLMSTLMGTIYGLFSLYSSFLSAGREQVERQQLVRAVTTLLQADFEQVGMTGQAAQPTNEELSADSIAQFPEVGFTDSDALTELDDGLVRLPVLQLTGSSTTLHLVVQAPTMLPAGQLWSVQEEPANPLREAQDSVSALEGSAAPDVPSLVHVLYLFEPPGLVDTLNQRPDWGFHRMQCGWLEYGRLGQVAASRSIDQIRSTDEPSISSLISTRLLDNSSRSPDHTHIPEIVRFTFSYSDGASWIDSWNSLERQELPAAVRIRFELVSGIDLSKLRNAIDPSSETDAGLATETLSTPITPGASEDALEDPVESLERFAFTRIILVDPMRKTQSQVTTGLVNAEAGNVNADLP